MKLLFQLSFIGLALIFSSARGYSQINLRYLENETLEYNEVITAYQYLADKYEKASLFEIGKTDIGKPLHLFIMTQNRDFESVLNGKTDKCIVFINNGIHPGEPPGIDASIQFSMDILSGHNKMDNLLDNTVLCIIPVYSVGGALNRSPYHRSNQETPPESGFRGNGKNLDLNRDFVKMDSKNARSLIRTFQKINPHIFLDTHTTNGSDHQYAITLIPTIYQKLPVSMSGYFDDIMLPALYGRMKETGYEMTPYVNWVHRDPSQGIASYFDAPRVSTGFASLFNCYAFMTENHVYKEFKYLVQSVYNFMFALTEYANDHHEEIISTRKKANEFTSGMSHFTSKWESDTTKYETIIFKGYEAGKKESPISGLQVFSYDRDKPYEKEIPFYKYFISGEEISKPYAYVIPQAWEKAIHSLEINGVEMSQISKDTIIEVEAYYITGLSFSKQPSNGHFRNRDIQVRKETQSIHFYKGDYAIVMNQRRNRFIMEMIEPTTIDSYLSWNFFDPVFDRREYFSSLGFEKNALKYLDENPTFKHEFEKRKSEDNAFAEDHYAQMRFIYSNSPYMEKSYRRYPVYRIEKFVDLPVD
ncbi:MAG: hypothetical protein U9N53_05065 [Bacteroidota bacterium]|nr:hypothetical protein [Bacteroidota bacterium]